MCLLCSISLLLLEDLYVSPTKVDMVLEYLEGGHLQA